MKKNLLFLALALVALSASAQQNQTPAEQPAAIVAQPALRFGYFSFEQVFHTMPGYAIAKHNMDELRAKYDEETKRVETEFNTKYEEFLDGQRSYAKTILEKRQAELRELMEKNIAFKAEAAKLLSWQIHRNTVKSLRMTRRSSTSFPKAVIRFCSRRTFGCMMILPFPCVFYILSNGEWMRHWIQESG